MGESHLYRHEFGRESRRNLRSALTKLTPREREVFSLRFFDRLKGDELASRLGVKTTSATVMVCQVRKKVTDLVTQKKGVVR